MANQAHRAEERFSVAATGMAQLHAGRRPEHLIKELIQNSFDENPAICSVTVTAEQHGILVLVEDDGPGFADIRNAYTLMADTPKRMDPEKRGRFNLGDKEVISISKWATVDTVGWTIRFPEEGGREMLENTRTKGTTITAMMPWHPEQAHDLEEKLGRIRPPTGTIYTVNKRIVKRDPTLRTARGTLPTVVQDSPQGPLRSRTRATDILIIGKHESDQAFIFEMGIPIQPIELPYHVDIMQKVPMPPNRDTVSDAYLRNIYTIVLNAMHGDMPGEQFAEGWVKTAIEQKQVTPEAVKDTIRERYGDKVVTWSSDTDANLKALDAGYQVLHPRTMSKPELQNMRQLGGLQGARTLFGRTDEPGPTLDISNDETKKDWAKWVRKIGEVLGLEIIPEFVHNPAAKMTATCTANTTTPYMKFNTAKLDDHFLSQRGAEQLQLIIHELGHAVTDANMFHGPRWGEGCAEIGAALLAAKKHLPTGDQEEER